MTSSSSVSCIQRGPVALGNERTYGSRTRRIVFKQLALKNNMDTYIPRISEHLGTIDLRKRLNHRRREAQVYYP
ncbi:hypothetical protein PanWU01x14_321500 [Parasponia andersonii]|uniref:Uncharacterized protein n=1 Tax=Parasponia andersonii TaxID=3476 RepID=A0A2P5AL94_PARAD|nr:hypothetical protein PanWU01x14_321500 [Parasponia andersonii]